MLLGWKPYQHIRLFKSHQLTPFYFSTFIQYHQHPHPMISALCPPWVQTAKVCFLLVTTSDVWNTSFLSSCWRLSFIYMFCLILLHITAHPVQNVMNQVFRRLLTATLTTFWQTAILKLKCFLLGSQVSFWKYLSTYWPLAFVSSCGVCSEQDTHCILTYWKNQLMQALTCSLAHIPADMRVPQRGLKDYKWFNIRFYSGQSSKYVGWLSYSWLARRQQITSHLTFKGTFQRLVKIYLYITLKR